MATTKEPAKPTQVYKVEIAAPIRRVWDEITSTGRVQRMMFDTILDGDVRPGGKIRYVTRSRKHTFIVGEVLEVQPPTRLVHTFAWRDLKDEPPSLVTWDLRESGGRTSVTVTHERMESAPETAKRVGGGWPTILDNLKSVVERGNVGLKWRLMLGMMRLALVFKPRDKD
jgi:uncharacterized protein YndB with AHSA1/START domain